jgi:hypothetical protein
MASLGSNRIAADKLHFEMLFVEHESFFKLKNLLTVLTSICIFIILYTLIAVKKLSTINEYNSPFNTYNSSFYSFNSTSSNLTNSTYDVGVIECKPFADAGFLSINYISHPFAAIIIILYVFMNKRRSFATSVLGGRPGLPQIISPFSKTRRYTPSLVYCVIAYHVYRIIHDTILAEGKSDTDFLGKSFHDPTGLTKFAIKIVMVLLAALRFYLCFYI